MVGKVAELENVFSREQQAEAIVRKYSTSNNQRQEWLGAQREKRNFLFATDTRHTSAGRLPWKNSTTTPKLTQIRDNLHANYMAALFPNDDWAKWEGYSQDDDTQDKAEAIQGYMSNKLREGKFMSVVSKAVYDYIDYGIAIGDAEYIDETREDSITGEEIPGFKGPRAKRISPLDIVFNPACENFGDSYKIMRSIKTFGELEADAQDMPDKQHYLDALKKAREVRSAAANGAYSSEDFDKAAGFSVDGFGSLQEYFQSPYVEILEFEGDLHDPVTDRLERNQVITVIDRSYVIRRGIIPSWLGKGNKVMVGWRERPDNLYAMGPLDNLVGMQYRIDHLENLKADVFDLIAYPPLVIKGEVEPFEWMPNSEIHITDPEGSVEMLRPDTTALNADFQIDRLEQKMEDMVGAPKQAMGIRTPGEKTAHEVQTLENAAGRIFNEKVRNFEINFVEPLLNSMLEMSRRNLDTADVIRVMDDDIGVTKFLTITKEDITAKGTIRPVGARHFAARAQMMQNLTGIFNSPVGQVIAPHLSPKQLAKMMEELIGVEKFQLIRDNVAVFENAETQKLAEQTQEDAEVESITPTE